MGNNPDGNFFMMMKMMMKIINNNKFYWFAICDFEIFGRIGRSFICM